MYYIDNNLYTKLPKDYQKSPLNYPGSKRLATEHVLSLIPEGTKEVLSPFFGGGSVELAMASCGVEIYGYDIFDFVVSFWKEALDRPDLIADVALSEFPMTRERFYELQHSDFSKQPQFVKACTFFLLNKSSFSGTGFSGGCSNSSLKRFSLNSIQRLRDFKPEHVHVDGLSFEDSINKHEGMFIYLDPPYINKAKNLYGKNGNTHRHFKHEDLSKILNTKSSWVLSYNDCGEIRELYKDRRILVTNWRHPMTVDPYNEVLIISDDLPEVKEK